MLLLNNNMLQSVLSTETHRFKVSKTKMMKKTVNTELYVNILNK